MPVVEIEVLNRNVRKWVCRDCGKAYPILPERCPCGHTEFSEKHVPLEDMERAEYEVLRNFLYESRQYNAFECERCGRGWDDPPPSECTCATKDRKASRKFKRCGPISLPKGDTVTRNMVKNNLIREIHIKQKKG